MFPVWNNERKLVRTDTISKKSLSLFKPISQKYPRGNSARLSTKAESAREYSVGVGIIAETKVGMGQP